MAVARPKSKTAGAKTAKSAKRVQADPPPASLTIQLNDAGMTPVLRAGLGGLAASLRAIDRLPRGKQPPGTWTVEPDRVVLDWGKPGDSGPFLKALFEASFQIKKPHGLIDLPGAWGDLPPEVHGPAQEALRRTFLQHGKMAVKDGAPKVCSFELDGQQHAVEVQPYASFVQQGAWKEIASELDKPLAKRKPIKLAAWAHPGAVERHVGVSVTKWEYSPAQALCGCFAIVGCVSYLAPRGGALVVPQPRDLVAFARSRPAMTPRDMRQVQMASPGDAVLTAQLALALDESASRDCIATTTGFAFRPTAWASQQKSRVDRVEAGRLPDATVDLFDRVMRQLPARVGDTKEKKGKPSVAFTVPSPLRALIADNMVRGRRWYAGFATTRDPSDRDRFVHYYYRQDNKGALRREEQKGLRVMIDKLDDAETVLVRSVHTALRQRLGAIAEENRGNPIARNKRWEHEREKWRLAFAGARTLEQTRHALADMWSRAGNVKELKDGWMLVLQLLTEAKWQAARDLALVALASYEGKGIAAVAEAGAEEENAA